MEFKINKLENVSQVEMIEALRNSMVDVLLEAGNDEVKVILRGNVIGTFKDDKILKKIIESGGSINGILTGFSSCGYSINNVYGTTTGTIK